MALAFSHRARSRKAKAGLRTLLGRAPDAAEVGERLSRLARRTFGAAVVDASPRRLTLELHPAASPVTIGVAPDGDLEIRGETATVGPGYHADTLARLAQLLDELDYVWDPPDLATLQREAAAWMVAQLRANATRIAMPADRHFHVAGAVVQTAMGPRDAAWRDRVLAEPTHAADAFAWWSTGPGELERSRALHAMWHEVAWREPLDDAEHALLRRVDDDLRAARKANPALALPYAEWAELLDWLGEGERAAKTRARAGDDPRSPPQAIGYRRHPMDVELDGWTFVLPGAFVAHREDDRWWATDGDRAIQLVTFAVDEPMSSAELLAVAPETHPVRDRFADERRCARIEAHDEDGIHVLHGIVAQTPHVAIATCKSHLADERWALAAWRSLVYAG